MSQTVQPSTLAGASIVIQIFLLLISYVALILLSKSYAGREVTRRSYSTLVAWILITLVLLLMGEDLYATWEAILGSISLPTVPRNYSYLAVFFIDIIFVTILILRTGGTKNSPFTSILFLLPTLAIFLREPTGRFLSYAITVGIVYAALLRKRLYVPIADFDRSEYDGPSKSDQAIEDWATIWTNISCLVLATLVGYITRPI